MGRGRYCNGLTWDRRLTWGGGQTHLRHCGLWYCPGLAGLQGRDLHCSRLCGRLPCLSSGLLDCLALCAHRTPLSHCTPDRCSETPKKTTLCTGRLGRGPTLNRLRG